MKTKFLPITLLISALLHTPIAIQAQTQFESDGIMYEVTDAQQKTVKVIENTTHPYEQQGSKDYVLVPQVAYDNTTYSVTEIDKNAFYNCGITSIVIPEGIKRIGSNAFYQNNMTTVSLPSTVEYIEGNAFRECTMLTELALNEGLKEIGNYAFYTCKGLKTITLPSTLTSIGTSFNLCFNLWKVVSLIQEPFAITEDAFSASVYRDAVLVVPAGAKAAYQATDGWKRFNEIKEEGENIHGQFFYDDEFRYEITDESAKTVRLVDNYYSRKGYVIPAQVSHDDVTYNVTEIGENAFYNCGITSIVIPEGVKRIGENAFGGNNLTTLTLPSTMEYIGANAFWNNNLLAELKLNEGLMEIAMYAFNGCISLTEVTLPSTLQVMDFPFIKCYNLTKVVSRIMVPMEIMYDSFPRTVYDCVPLEVPVGTLDAYKSTSTWNRFRSIIEYDPAAINRLNTDNKTERYIYDLQGRRVDKPEKGIYVIDGKPHICP